MSMDLGIKHVSFDSKPIFNLIGIWLLTLTRLSYYICKIEIKSYP